MNTKQKAVSFIIVSLFVLLSLACRIGDPSGESATATFASNEFNIQLTQNARP